MTDQELKDLVASLAVNQQETDKKLDRINDLLGNIGRNNGFFAEDLFLAALEKKPQIGNIKFDSVHSHVKGLVKKGFDQEYDIVLQNGAYIGLVEVKYRLHPADVKKFATEAIPRFKEFFPQFADKKLIGAVASTSIPEESLQIAREHGLAVIAPDGQQIRFLNSETRDY